MGSWKKRRIDVTGSGRGMMVAIGVVALVAWFLMLWFMFGDVL